MNTTTAPPPADLVSQVRDVTRVPLAQLAREHLAERKQAGRYASAEFNSSI